MIIDTSAIIAVANREPEAQAVGARIETEVAQDRLMSSATWLELMIVLDRGGNPERVGLVEQLLEQWSIGIVAVTAEHARIAREAYRHFGRGGGSGAKLNFGDCFSYALSRARREPLLFVGNDFVHTDIQSALG